MWVFCVKGEGFYTLFPMCFFVFLWGLGIVCIYILCMRSFIYGNNKNKKMKNKIIYRVYNMQETPEEGGSDFFDLCDIKQARNLREKLDTLEPVKNWVCAIKV